MSLIDHLKETRKNSSCVREKVTNSEPWSHLQCEAGGEMPLPVSHPQIPPASQLLQTSSSTSLPSRAAQDCFTPWWKESGVAEPKLESCLKVRHLHLLLIYFQLLYDSSLHVMALQLTLCWTLGPSSLLFSTTLKNFWLLASGTCLCLIFLFFFFLTKFFLHCPDLSLLWLSSSFVLSILPQGIDHSFHPLVLVLCSVAT